MDSSSEEPFDRLTRLAVETVGAPIALVSLVDGDRQFFKSAIGLAEPFATNRETPLCQSFCRHVVAGEPLVVSDVRRHPPLGEQLAVPGLGVVGYAGVPITLRSGETLGSLCAIDTEPRSWTEAELSILRDLAAAAATEIELRLALADAHERIRTDSLTGLLNHGALHERLGDEVSRAGRGSQELALVLFDIDHFKDVNDVFGHLAGDAAIAEVAARVRTELRRGDTLARVGGEEFAWILPGTSAEGAADAAERARRAVAATPMPGIGLVTVSAGVSDHRMTDEPQNLYRRADAALYAAKDAGRNQVAAADNPAQPSLATAHR